VFYVEHFLPGDYPGPMQPAIAEMFYVEHFYVLHMVAQQFTIAFEM
jgi:hypothetical protein